MKLHSVSWLIAPLIVLILVWAGAASSSQIAESLVETGLLVPSGSALILLPGARGAGIGVASVLIYTGISFIIGPLIALSSKLDYVWDDKDMIYAGSEQELESEKGSVVVED